MKTILCLLVWSVAFLIETTSSAQTSPMTITLVNDGAVSVNVVCKSFGSGIIAGATLPPGGSHVQNFVGNANDSLWFNAEWNDGTQNRVKRYGTGGGNYTVRVWAGPNTNCVEVLEKIKVTGDGFYRNYILFKNNTPVANYAFSSGTYNFSYANNPCSNDVWTVKTKDIVQIQNSDGTYSENYSPAPNAVQEAQTTMPTTGGIPGQTPGYTPNAGGVATPINPDSTNAPIKVVSTNTAPANNGTLLGVGDGIVNAINQASDRNHNDLSQLHNDLTKSNLFDMSLTNNPGLTTNDLHGMGGYIQNAQSNKMTGVIAAMNGRTNEAGALGFGSLSAALGPIASGLGMGGGGGGGYGVQIGSSATLMTIEFSSLDHPAVSVVYNLVTWLCYVFLFIANYKVFKDGTARALAAPQATTAGEEILGNNVNFVSALVVAGLIVAAVAVIPALFLPTLVSAASHIIGTPFGALSGLPAFGYAAAACPFATMVSVLGSHLVFRVLVDSIAAVTCGIIRFLVGL